MKLGGKFWRKKFKNKKWVWKIKEFFTVLIFFLKSGILQEKHEIKFKNKNKKFF
jgi:hypothetical protein